MFNVFKEIKEAFETMAKDGLKWNQIELIEMKI